MRRTSPRRRDRGRGFTLIEVMLVLIILVIMGSLAVNTFTGTREAANIRAVRAQIGLIRSGMDLYKLDMNKFPAQLEDLWTEPSDSTEAEKWLSGPYLDELGPDPWGNEYEYLAEGKKNPEGYDFWSNGPDGQSGTDDDIGNWDADEE